MFKACGNVQHDNDLLESVDAPEIFPETFVVEELTVAEAMVLFTVRLWTVAADHGEDSRLVLMQMHAQLASRRIATCIDSILQTVRSFGTCALATGCFCNANMTADEARLLALFAAFQQQRPADALTISSSWLPAPIATALNQRASMFTEGFGDMQLRVPDRHWNLPRLSAIAAAERRAQYDQVTNDAHLH